MGSMTLQKDALAMEGGPKAKTVPYGTGKRFGEPELAYLKEALDQNTLFYYKGNMVKRFVRKFADMYGFKHCVATSSGTASIHVALSAIGLSVGDEVIVPPITDQGSIIGILFQNALPIFADIHPHTYSLDPKSVEKAITPRTKAILAVHLTGGPIDMDGLLAVAKKHNIPVIEDCAQAYGTTYKGKRAGTMGLMGCYSTNDFKHMSTGDGGLIGTQDDTLAQLCFEIADKNYYRSGAAVGKSPKFLAPNYRMTELQGAVGLAQLDKVEAICNARRKNGDLLSELLQGAPGFDTHGVIEGGTCTYFSWVGRIRPAELTCGIDDFVKAACAEGVFAWRNYSAPVYQYALFQDRNIYQHSKFPLEGTGKTYAYEKGLCPVAESIVETAVAHPISEFYTEQDIEETAKAFRKVCERYAK
ncbi:MAG: DegT/DnrJ/EryC1/StrS family aminotransferase [Fibrobacterota bacterium]